MSVNSDNEKLAEKLRSLSLQSNFQPPVSDFSYFSELIFCSAYFIVHISMHEISSIIFPYELSFDAIVSYFPLTNQLRITKHLELTNRVSFKSNKNQNTINFCNVCTLTRLANQNDLGALLVSKHVTLTRIKSSQVTIL